MYIGRERNRIIFVERMNTIEYFLLVISVDVIQCVKSTLIHEYPVVNWHLGFYNISTFFIELLLIEFVILKDTDNKKS